MKKAAPLLSKAIKAGAIVGVGDAAINTIDKIAKGESFTISDARRLINGISSGVTLKRTGLLTPKGQKTKVGGGFTVPGKNNAAGIDISKSDLDDIMKLESSKRADAIEELVIKK